MKTIRIYLVYITFIITCHSHALCYAQDIDIPKLGYTKLGVNKSFDSYYSEESIEMSTWPANLAMISLEEKTGGIRFFKAKPGWEMLKLHHAPKRQYLLVLQGILEIHTSTDQIRQFKQGSILLVEDTFGEGHRTRNGGKSDLLLAWVSLESK